MIDPIVPDTYAPFSSEPSLATTHASSLLEACRTQIDRLQALAGNDPIPWDGTYPTWCSLYAESVLPVVARARERLAFLTTDKFHDTGEAP